MQSKTTHKLPIHKIAGPIIFLALWLFAFSTGWLGVDFGTHWDERKLMKSVRDTMQTGIILPGWYNYPSMIYDLAILTRQGFLAAQDNSTFLLSARAQELLPESSKRLSNLVKNPQNADYYPSWAGDNRVIVMPMQAALAQPKFNLKK